MAKQKSGVRFSIEFWDTLREFWETTPQISIEDAGKRVAERFNISPPNRVTISRRKSAEKWEKIHQQVTSMTATELNQHIKKNKEELREKLNIGKTDKDVKNNKNQNDTNTVTASATTECYSDETATLETPTEEQQRRIDKVLGGGSIDSKGEFVDITDIYEQVIPQAFKDDKKTAKKKTKKDANKDEKDKDELSPEQQAEIQEAEVMLRCASLIDLSEVEPLTKRIARNKLSASLVVKINRNLIHDLKETTDLLQLAGRQLALKLITSTDPIEMKILNKKTRALLELKELFTGLTIQASSFCREDKVLWNLTPDLLEDREEKEAQRTIHQGKSAKVLEAEKRAMAGEKEAHTRKMELLMQQKLQDEPKIEYKGIDLDDESMPIGDDEKM